MVPVLCHASCLCLVLKCVCKLLQAPKAIDASALSVVPTGSIAGGKERTWLQQRWPTRSAVSQELQM